MSIERKEKSLCDSVFLQFVNIGGCLTLFLLFCIPSSSQQYPFRQYTPSDGLAHGAVLSAYQDRKGYIWFSTLEGLSRFDGYDFVNYSAKDGLEQAVINHAIEDNQGRLWVATNGSGVALLTENLRDKSGKKFKTFLIYSDKSVADWKAFNHVNRIAFDSNNNIFALTDRGLFRASLKDENLLFVPIKIHNFNSSATLTDSHGSLWFGVFNELVEVRGNQVISHSSISEDIREGIVGIVQNYNGRILVASRNNLFEFVPPISQGQKGLWNKIGFKLKPKQRISRLFVTSSGNLFIGTNSGLIKLRHDNQQTEINSEIFGSSLIRSFAEDRDGNLWIGTEGEGAFKLGSEMLISYTNLEGINLKYVYGFFDDGGAIKAYNRDYDIFEFTENGVKQITTLKNPLGAERPLHISFRDNNWWAWNYVKIYKLKLRLRNGRELLFTELASVDEYKKKIVFYEDENGKLWLNKDDGKIYRADTNTQSKLTFESFVGNVDTFQGNHVVSDGVGGIWLTAWFTLCRIHQYKFSCLQGREGMPEINPRSLFVDSRGWLWVGHRYSGVSITKDRAAENPVFTYYSTDNGLLSDAVWDIVEDNKGRVYLGTGKGLSRFDPNNESWQHFTRKDGLAGDAIPALHKDKYGQIWIAASDGITIFNPQAERKSTTPPPIYISRIRILNKDLPLSELGASVIPFIKLSSSQNNIHIDFVGLQYQSEDSLFYQYKLEGADENWSAFTKSRSVDYARLAAGDYRFLVRAVTRNGLISEPASFEFRILKPFYLRWWFIAVIVLSISGLAYSFYHRRVQHLLELERIRTRIASDLHDDIGANLSLIAGLSEFMRAKTHRIDAQITENLALVSDVSRKSVEAMSDIVWAVNPHKDHLRDLVQRMRRFASDTFTAHDVEFTFLAPDGAKDIKLGADTRREVFLIFKESVNNIARHSQSTSAEINIEIKQGMLKLMLKDNGKGFNTNGAFDGQGLTSMKKRAEKLSGDLSIVSNDGNGTTVILTVPL